MKLIIMRHGEAETAGKPDRQRCLTPNGIEQADVAGTWLSQYLAEHCIDLAVVSPFARTEQTFATINRQIACSQMIVCEDVIPAGNPQLAHDYIQVLLAQNDVIENLLVVSHMPFVSYFLADTTTNQCSMLFDTSSIVIVDYELDIHSGLVENIYHPK